MLFNRTARIEFDDKVETIKVINDLRIQFEVDKNDGVSANHGVIHIFNLNPTSRRAIARTIPQGSELVNPITVYLYAGYQDENILIFSGTILESRNYRIGPNWITELIVYTGLEAIHKGFQQKNYKEKTSVKKIIDDMLSVLNMDVQYTQDARTAIQNKFKTSYSYSALVISEVQTLLYPYGLEFTVIEHDQCLIFKKDSPWDEAVQKNNENTFKPSNGLIGTPQLTPYGAVFRSLLRPAVRILQRVYLESQTMNSSIQNNPGLAPE